MPLTGIPTGTGKSNSSSFGDGEGFGEGSARTGTIAKLSARRKILGDNFTKGAELFNEFREVTQRHLIGAVREGARGVLMGLEKNPVATCGNRRPGQDRSEFSIA